MKNKDGWGLSGELLMIFIFIVCLIIAIIGINKLGLLANLNSAFNPNYYSNTNTSTEKKEENKIDTNKNNSNTNLNNSDKNYVIIDKDDTTYFSYTNLESKIVGSAKKYVNDIYQNNLGLDTLIIRSTQLINNNYLTDFVDEKKLSCSGYVEVYKKDENILYDPYIKCANYETKGYIERRDY